MRWSTTSMRRRRWWSTPAPSSRRPSRSRSTPSSRWRAARARASRRCWWPAAWCNRFGDQLAKEIPEIDGFVGLDQLRDVGDVVQLGGGPPLPAPSHLVFDHTAPRLLTTQGHAYLKVAEGCNNPCTFCAIPHLARPLPQPHDREPGGGGEAARSRRHHRAQPHRPGHHPLRRGSGDSPARPRAPGRGPARRDLDPLDPVPLRLSNDAGRGSAAADGHARSVSAPISTCPLQHSHGEILAAMRRGGDAQALPAAAGAGAGAGAGRLPALHLHRRLPRRDGGALPRSPGLHRASPLRSPRRLCLQPRGGDAGRRAWRPGAAAGRSGGGCASSWRPSSRSPSRSGSGWWAGG